MSIERNCLYVNAPQADLVLRTVVSTFRQPPPCAAVRALPFDFSCTP